MINILNWKKKNIYIVKKFNFNKRLWKNSHLIYVQKRSFSDVYHSNCSIRPLSELELNYTNSLSFYFHFLKGLNYILLVYFLLHFFNCKRLLTVSSLELVFYYWPLIQSFFILCYFLVLVKFLCFYILYWFLLFDDSLLFYLIPFYKRFLVLHIKYFLYVFGLIYVSIFYYSLLDDLNWSIFFERWDTFEGWWAFYDSLENRWDRRRVWITSWYTGVFLDLLVITLAHKVCEALIEEESYEDGILYYFIIWRITYRSFFFFTLIKYFVNLVIFCLGLLFIFFLSILILVINIVSIECMAGVIIQFLKFLYFRSYSFWSFFLDKWKYIFHLIIDYNDWATSFIGKNTLRGGPIREFEIRWFGKKTDLLSRALYNFFNYGLKFSFFYCVCYFFYTVLRVFIYFFGLFYKILFFIIGLPIRLYVNYRYKDLYIKYVIIEKRLTFEEFVSLIFKGDKAFKRGIEKLKKKNKVSLKKK